MMDRSQDGRETQISIRREGDQPRPATGRARLLFDALEALLRTADDPFAIVFKSLRAVRENPGPMAAWGLIIAAGLVIGAIPLLVGLAIVLPILGHATWHLYRKVVG